MKKLWFSLGIINLLAAAGTFVDQIIRFNVVWEWDEFFHHEAFVGICLYAGFLLLIVALVEYIRSLKT